LKWGTSATGSWFGRSRVQVDKPYRSTPIFHSAITYLVLNPTWTVPPGIEAMDGAIRPY